MYELFEHTADLGLRVHAATLAELFAQAGRGLCAMTVENVDDVAAVEHRQLRIEGTQLDYLLFDWLNELLFVFETEELLLTEFDVTLTDAGLQADCRGEHPDRSRHHLTHEVKAITYHGLKLEQKPDGWWAEVIVDI